MQPASIVSIDAMAPANATMGESGTAAGKNHGSQKMMGRRIVGSYSKAKKWILYRHEDATKQKRRDPHFNAKNKTLMRTKGAHHRSGSLPHRDPWSETQFEEETHTGALVEGCS